MSSHLPRRHQAARSSPAPSPALQQLETMLSCPHLPFWPHPGPSLALPGDARTHSRCLDRLGAGEKGWAQQASLWPRTGLIERQVPKSSSSSFTPPSPFVLLITATICWVLIVCLTQCLMMYVYYLLNPKSILNRGHYYPHLSDEAVELWRGHRPCPSSPC